MNTASWVIAVGVLATAFAGCQLLLPSEDDGSTSAGGASTSSSSSGKTTGSKSSSDAVSTGAETTGASMTTTSGQSSSSGNSGCQPGSATCTNGFQSPLPHGCAMSATCSDSPECTAYCNAMNELCPGAYANQASCCGACVFISAEKSKPGQCCHVNALNALASGSNAPDACTIAGPFGSATEFGSGSGCGGQAGSICQFYDKGCGSALGMCPTTACLAYFTNEPPVHYKQNTDPQNKLSHAMDVVLSGDDNKCSVLAEMFCPPTTSSTGASTGTLSPVTSSASTGP